MKWYTNGEQTAEFGKPQGITPRHNIGHPSMTGHKKSKKGRMSKTLKSFRAARKKKNREEKFRRKGKKP